MNMKQRLILEIVRATGRHTVESVYQALCEIGNGQYCAGGRKSVAKHLEQLLRQKKIKAVKRSFYISRKQAKKHRYFRPTP